jgi:hypothetical protein
MTPEELLEGFNVLTRNVYSIPSILTRFLGVSPWKRTLDGCRLYAGFNLATRQRYQKDRGVTQPLMQPRIKNDLFQHSINGA